MACPCCGSWRCYYRPIISTFDLSWNGLTLNFTAATGYTPHDDAGTGQVFGDLVSCPTKPRYRGGPNPPFVVKYRLRAGIFLVGSVFRNGRFISSPADLVCGDLTYLIGTEAGITGVGGGSGGGASCWKNVLITVKEDESASVTIYSEAVPAFSQDSDGCRPGGFADYNTIGDAEGCPFDDLLTLAYAKARVAPTVQNVTTERYYLCSNVAESCRQPTSSARYLTQGLCKTSCANPLP